MNRVQPDTTTTIPIIKGIYTAVINQEGTAAPTAVVLQNTLGNETEWTRLGTGIYQLEITGAIPDINKVTVVLNAAGGIMGGNSEEPDKIIIGTMAWTGANSDALLYDATIEIKVYN